MSKKVLGIGIIVVLIIIIVLIIMIFSLNNSEDKIFIENENVVGSQENKIDDSQSVENVINEYYEYMKNKDFKSASELFDEDGFYNLIRQTSKTESIDEILEMSYNDFEEFYFYSIKSIRQISGIEDFRSSTNIEITDEEYQGMFGNYKLYLAQIDISDKNIFDVYIFTTDDKMANTIRVMNTYATGGMIGQAKDSREDVEKAEIKERIAMAINSILYSNNASQFKESCTKENLQENITKATINEFVWENDIGRGTITNDEGTTYSFTIDLNYNIEVSDAIETR